MKYDNKSYGSARQRKNEYVFSIVEQYAKSNPTTPSLIDCWEYVNDIIYLTKDYFLSTLSQEEVVIVEQITFDKFFNTIRNYQTFPIYLKNNNMDKILEQTGINV